MFVDVTVVLAGAESSIFLFDEKERRGLGRIGWSNFPRGDVLIQEVFGGFSFIGGEGIYFPDLQGEGVVKIDLMIIGSGRRDVVSGFF